MIGRLVYSRTGRDSGKAFVVVQIDPQGYLLLADGDIRKIERPKAKNPKHVQITDTILDEVRAILLKGEQPENHFLRSNLRQLLGTC